MSKEVITVHGEEVIVRDDTAKAFDLCIGESSRERYVSPQW